MINWTLVETTLQSWVEGLTGLPATWQGSPPKPSFSDAGHLVLSITANRALGHPELVTTYNVSAPAGEEMETTQDNVETFTFGVQIRTYGQSPSTDATYRAHLIRSQCCMPVKTDAVLEVANLAYARILADTPVATLHDGRTMSVHQVDILINTSDSTSDTPVGYISTVDDAELEVPEGTPVGTYDFEV